MAEPQRASCPVCGGGGWRVIETAEGSHASRCECWRASDRPRKLGRAGIPTGLQHCELESFETAHHAQLQTAMIAAQSFVDSYPLPGPGLLFHGSVGTGKTHIMVGIVSALVLKKNARALFLDFRDLLKTIQQSWDAVSQTSEKEVLRRVLDVDVLALDDLGAEKPSPWVRETVAYVINERYVRGKPLLLTTNLRYTLPSAERDEPRRGMAQRVGREGDRQPEYLEDRLGTATLSRLYEMCKHIELTDVADYRRTVKFFGADKGWRLG